MQANIGENSQLVDAQKSKGMIYWLKMIMELGRAKLVIAVTLSGVMGYFLFAKRFDWEVLLPILGIFWLGCGCSALNQIQEIKTDAIMTRTRNRPLPSGRMELAVGWFWTLVMIFTGVYFLASIEHHTYVILLMALFTLIWYNGFYTYLKGVSAFAVIPGALLGVIPPMIGWCAAGGMWWDANIMMVAVYFFVWQIPHFWLLMMMRGNEYENAGLASITKVFSTEQFYRITFVWLVATALLGFCTAFYLQAKLPWMIAIVISSVWLIVGSLDFLRGKAESKSLKPAFLRCVFYNVLFMLFLTIDALT